MSITPVEEVHVRKCRVILNRRELEAIIKEHVLKATGFAAYATEVTLRFPDATEGSPPYKVGTECIADLAEDQMKMPRAEAPPHDA